MADVRAYEAGEQDYSWCGFLQSNRSPGCSSTALLLDGMNPRFQRPRAEGPARNPGPFGHEERTQNAVQARTGRFREAEGWAAATDEVSSRSRGRRAPPTPRRADAAPRSSSRGRARRSCSGRRDQGCRGAERTSRSSIRESAARTRQGPADRTSQSDPAGGRPTTTAAPPMPSAAIACWVVTMAPIASNTKSSPSGTRVLQLLDDVARSSVDDVGGAQRQRQLELGRHEVDGHDPARHRPFAPPARTRARRLRTRSRQPWRPAGPGRCCGRHRHPWPPHNRRARSRRAVRQLAP